MTLYYENCHTTILPKWVEWFNENAKQCERVSACILSHVCNIIQEMKNQTLWTSTIMLYQTGQQNGSSWVANLIFSNI